MKGRGGPWRLRQNSATPSQSAETEFEIDRDFHEHQRQLEGHESSPPRARPPIALHRLCDPDRGSGRLGAGGELMPGIEIVHSDYWAIPPIEAN